MNDPMRNQKIRRSLVAALGTVLLAECASTSSVPLSADTVQINTSVAPICGGTRAASVASKMAAVETLRHGFDRYVILDSRGENNVGVIGYTPTVAQTTYGGGTATTQVYGGQPIVAGTHDHGLIVKMFKDGDPQGANAIPARQILGPKWAEVVQSSTYTCFD
ncbi:MAG: hypothetical protein WBX25_03285 [Rhodomicrobium sp.]